MAHFVGRVDWDRVAAPQPSSATSSGLARAVVVGPDQGAVHTELAIGSLHAGGWIGRHFHSFEESLYVLGGELLLEIDGTVHRLHKGDFALVPIGVRHTLANARDEAVRWMSMNTPQRLAPDAGRKDTFFEKEPPSVADLDGRAERPAFGPTLRWVGHYDGTPPQAEALRLNEPARGRESAGMDTALIMYSGISVRMLIDRVFGAELLTMFTVDYEPGGSAQQHDHPFEEAYFFLDGECEAELDGTVYTVRAGDVVFAGVGAVHGFYNNGPGRVRWIETQAPQPPGRHAYRWVPVWKRFEEE
jgi:quercetin dioxygenase-like cupin family protein